MSTAEGMILSVLIVIAYVLFSIEYKLAKIFSFLYAKLASSEPDFSHIADPGVREICERLKQDALRARGRIA